MTHKNILIGVIVSLLIGGGLLGSYWLYTLNVAHSSFDNYYRFRGCQNLLEKTTTYGRCITASGETIKIVAFKGKWYLDGDLPGTW